jgi:hypothetical protein
LCLCRGLITAAINLIASVIIVIAGVIDVG